MKRILTTIVLSLLAFSCGTGNKTKLEKILYYNAVVVGKSFDPQVLTDGNTMNIHSFITEGLTETLPDGKVIPKQAKSWEISKDGLTWTFKLRDDIKWSDGSDVVADDFVYAWQRALSPKLASEYAFILFPIKNAEKYTNGEVSIEEVGVKALDNKTLQVQLENVTPYFDSLVSFITYMPAKRSFVEKQGEEYALEKENLLYNGAFVINDWVHNDKITLVKNDKYYDKDTINFDKVIIKYIKDDSAALNAFNNEELDFAKLSSEDAKRLLEDNRVKEISQARTTYLSYNTKTKIFGNENIRKAFSLAVNKKQLVDLVFNGLKEDIYTFTPKNSGIMGLEKDFSSEVGEAFPKFNPEEAKKYLSKGLKELGIKKLPKVTLLIDDRYTFNRRLGETLQEDFRTNLGVDVVVDVVTFKERLARTNAEQFDILLTVWGADYQDPMTFMDLLASFNGNNSSKFNDPKYDEFIKMATISVNRKDRINYLKQAEYYLGKKMPILPLFQEKDYYIINSKLKNVSLSSFSPVIRLVHADKDK